MCEHLWVAIAEGQLQPGAVSKVGGVITALDVVESHYDRIVIDVTCNASDAAHADTITDAVDALEGVRVRDVSDRTLDRFKTWIMEYTNTDGHDETLREGLGGADVFIGVSAPNVLPGPDIASMADRAIVLALANPDPEVDPI